MKKKTKKKISPAKIGRGVMKAANVLSKATVQAYGVNQDWTSERAAGKRLINRIGSRIKRAQKKSPSKKSHAKKSYKKGKK